MILWEVLWTDLPCPNFHIIICSAILDLEKSNIMANELGFTEILKVGEYLNSVLLSGGLKWFSNF